MLGILIFGIIYIIVKEIEYRRWAKKFDEDMCHYNPDDRTFLFKGMYGSVEEIYDKVGKENIHLGDVYTIGKSDSYKTYIWTGKEFAELGTTGSLNKDDRKSICLDLNSKLSDMVRNSPPGTSVDDIWEEFVQKYNPPDWYEERTHQ